MKFEIVTFVGIELYEAFIGEPALWVHITLYIVGVIFGIQAGRYAMEHPKASPLLKQLGRLILLLHCVFLILFTIDPPHTEFFRDPISGTYGIYESIE